MWYKTQDEYDEIVSAMVSFEVRFADKVGKLRRSNDPDAFRLEEELMLLQNVIYSLVHYDITSDVLSETDINNNYELATQVIQNCSL